MTKLIDTIDLPRGLRELSVEELTQVADELRCELIEKVGESGGHFASSLGATEITVALHHMFATPYDRVIWDVGHQAYVHKMVTGRRQQLSSIRKKDGISGFLRRDESPFDAFGAGHAGTSISAAVGMSLVFNRDHSPRFVVSVIGDASITAGMALEALNHAGSLGLKNFIVLLNDNEMSISPNVGALSWLFSRAVTSRSSTIARSSFKNLHRKGYVPDFVYKFIDRAEEAAQGFFAGAAMLFEAFGFRYIGPVDGHDVGALLKAIEHAKQQDVPVLIHAYTVKGKGYEPAESDPLKWHATSPFLAKSPSAHSSANGSNNNGSTNAVIQSLTTQIKKPPSYTSVFADTLIQLAKDDARIIAITAAMPTGTGLDKFERELPTQFLDVGICEQHAVTCAAGLACEGARPVCAIYSTFLQRVYDQVIHDVCIQNLPVVFALDRAGLVGNDGETHQGAFDTAYMRTVPNMTIMSPKDECELQHMLYTALKMRSPVAVRFPRGDGLGVSLAENLTNIEIGKSEVLCRGTDVLFISFGPIIQNAMAAAQRLESEFDISATVINARFAKPLDHALICEEISKHSLICTVEDGAVLGGFGSAVLELVNAQGIVTQNSIKCFGIADKFVPHASQVEQYQSNGFDVAHLVHYVIERMKPRKLFAVSA